MEPIGTGLKKILQAGLGAVATGAEKAQEAIENLSKKGEPLYQQAKSAVTGAAEKICQAVNDSGIWDAIQGKPNVLAVIDQLRAMSAEDRALIRAALDALEQRAAAEEATPAYDAAPDDPQPADAPEEEPAPDAEDAAEAQTPPSAE